MLKFTSAMDQGCARTIGGSFATAGRRPAASMTNPSGLPAPIDAFARIPEALEGKTLREAKWDARTGDVMLSFEAEIELQVFNFTGYEAWEIHFSNGTTEYSPQAR